MLSRRERFAAGLAARQHLPRGQHAIWSPPADRRNPVDILGGARPLAHSGTVADALRTHAGLGICLPARFGRGHGGGPGGPAQTGLIVQLCGDAHLANFGTFASPEERPLFDVNDFDETLPGPFEWDVKRLAASLAVYGGDAGLEKAARKALAARSVRAYRKHMARLAHFRRSRSGTAGSISTRRSMR